MECLNRKKNDLTDEWAHGVDAWHGGSRVGEELRRVEGAVSCGLRSHASARRESRGREGERVARGAVVGPGDRRWVHHPRWWIEYIYIYIYLCDEPIDASPEPKSNQTNHRVLTRVIVERATRPQERIRLTRVFCWVSGVSFVGRRFNVRYFIMWAPFMLLNTVLVISMFFRVFSHSITVSIIPLLLQSFRHNFSHSITAFDILLQFQSFCHSLGLFVVPL
jgi:hypothetical protein